MDIDSDEATTRHLPPEIWSRVFWHLIEVGRGEDAPPTRDLYSLLTVSKTFFKAAAPHLYRRVQVADMCKWLRGALNEFPHLPVDESDHEIIFRGNTKLPLLRHTQHLILLSPSYRPDERLVSEDGGPKSVDDYASEEQTKLIKDGMRQSAMIDDSSDILTTITSDDLSIFSKLSLVQIGRRDWEESYFMAPWMYQEQGAIGCLLMRKLQPRYWCQFGNGGIFSHPSTRPTEYQRGHLPEIYTAHTNVRESFVVLWGTTNHIYIMHSRRSEASRAEMGRDGLISWIANNITDSYPECLGTASRADCPIKVEVEQRTRFIIHNLVLRSAANKDNQQQQSRECLEWQDSLREYFASNVGRTAEHWKTLIKVAPPEGDEICPRCQTGSL